MHWLRSVRQFFGFGLGGTTCPEARLFTSELDIARAKLGTGVLVGQPDAAAISDAYSKGQPSEQIMAAAEVRRKELMRAARPELMRWVASLRGRYAIASGAAAAQRYLASNPPPTTATTDDELRAEGSFLLDRLSLIYRLSHLRDEWVRFIQRCGLVILVVLLISLVGLAFVPTANDLTLGSVVNYLIVAVAGAGGAMMSIMRRTRALVDAELLEVDPVRQVSALRHGRTGLFISLLSGPVFALILLVIFATDTIDISGLSPDFVDCIDPSDQDKAVCQSQNRVGFNLFGGQVYLEDSEHAARMVLWAFIAGFAEQLVPSVLDRFSDRLGSNAAIFRAAVAAANAPTGGGAGDPVGPGPGGAGRGGSNDAPRGGPPDSPAAQNAGADIPQDASSEGAAGTTALERAASEVAAAEPDASSRAAEQSPPVSVTNTTVPTLQPPPEDGPRQPPARDERSPLE